jgi:hypothetical protein
MAAVAFVTGCMRRAGPTRHTVSGTVTFRGQPVPAGTIAFEPDTRQGNRGPAGYADILNGRFRTHLGAISGPHLVRISGASGSAVDETKDTTLFSDYTTTCELPKGAATLHFEVPAVVPSSRR